jgi:uncharacterized iron-regulated protein
MIQLYVAMDHKELLKIKYDTYLNTRNKVQNMFGILPKQLKAYQKTYDKELTALFLRWKAKLKTSAKTSAKSDLLAELAVAKMVFVGDFHAQPQSARSFFRLIRSSRSKTVAVNLECFKRSDQNYLNLFIKGDISEKDFLHKIKWKKSWGFPFESVRPLLKWCQAHSIPVFGINTEAHIEDLKSRDEFMAHVLAENFRLEPQRTHFVLVGDFHISPAHLPKHLHKILPKLKSIIVYQSPEEVYFELVRKKIDHIDVVLLEGHKWAMLTVLPWVKWQEYLIYLESDFDKKIKSTDLDLTDYVCREVDFILRLLEVKLSVGNLASNLSVYSPVDQDFYNKINHSKLILSSKLRSQIDFLIKEGSSFYIPELKIGLLSRNTINHISKISAVVTLSLMGKMNKSIIVGRSNFVQMIWLEMIIYFFSKLINPKKKADTLNDIRHAVQKEGFDDRGKESLTLALEQKLSELQVLSFGKRARTFRRNYQPKSYKVASEILGGILGEKLYYAYRKNRISKITLINFLTRDLHDSFFEQQYYESIEIIDSWPSGFKSKYDHF